MTAHRATNSGRGVTARRARELTNGTDLALARKVPSNWRQTPALVPRASRAGNRAPEGVARCERKSWDGAALPRGRYRSAMGPPIAILGPQVLRRGESAESALHPAPGAMHGAILDALESGVQESHPLGYLMLGKLQDCHFSSHFAGLIARWMECDPFREKMQERMLDKILENGRVGVVRMRNPGGTMAIEVSKTGDITVTGEHIEVYRVLSLKSAIDLYLKAGVIVHRGVNPQRLREMATEYTGKSYKRSRRGLEAAGADLQAMLDAAKTEAK